MSIGTIIFLIFLLFISIPGKLFTSILNFFADSQNKDIEKNKLHQDEISSLNPKEKVSQEDRYQFYECDTCNGAGEVWICSYCKRPPSIEAEDRDGYNLFCKPCDEAELKYEIIEDVCPDCMGKKIRRY